MSALYIDSLECFLQAEPDQFIGKLTSGLAKEGFDTNISTTFSWQREIDEMQKAFLQLVQLRPVARSWQVLFEYVLPVVGQRVDCVLLADDIIYVIEYKGGETGSSRAALLQAQDYALNLMDFHEASRNRTAIPLAVGSFRTYISFNPASVIHGAAVAPAALVGVIIQSYDLWHRGSPIDYAAWNVSRYFPVPTIIQAASAIYQDHDVKDLAFSRSGSDNLEATQKAVATVVREARRLGTKTLVVLTGVPGAGKTLAGLNAVQLLARELNLEVEQASFLSGNGPLVKVIQTALRRSTGGGKKGTGRSIRSRIREIHRFVRDSYGDAHAPADRLIVFDEAQRAWTAAKNKKKFDRDISEPEMVLEIMGRHEGWAVIVALVGGGQEIHGGEAGLAAWGDAILKHPEWEVVTSPEAILGGASVAGSRLFRTTSGGVAKIEHQPALHLSISKRSYETEVTAAWVNAVLESRENEAMALATRGLPIYLTREIHVARTWLMEQARGHRRAGLVASSGAARLRAYGVEAPTFKFLQGIDYVKWFLEPAGDYRSSNQLEVAMSEFEMQGLELDLVGLYGAVI